MQGLDEDDVEGGTMLRNNEGTMKGSDAGMLNTEQTNPQITHVILVLHVTLPFRCASSKGSPPLSCIKMSLK